MFKKLRSKLLVLVEPEIGPIIEEDVFFNFKKRVLGRFKYKINKQFPEADYRGTTFKELFALPYWLPFEAWLLIQLRGRGVQFFKESSLDHVVPLSWAKTPAELIKLMSYKNTRLLDKEYNSRKASYVDEENKELCLYLLERYPDESTPQRPDPYETQRQAEQGDRVAKLLHRGKGMSQRMVTIRDNKKRSHKKGRK